MDVRRGWRLVDGAQGWGRARGASVVRGVAAGPSPLLRGTLLAASSLTVMAGATIAPALPAMAAHFSAVPNAELLARLALTLPGLAIALTAPFAGWALDRWGRKRLLAVAVLLYGVVGPGAYFLDSLPLILCTRVVLGLAVAVISTAVTALIADYFDEAERAKFLGKQAAAMALGGVVFLTGAGALAGIGWRLPFLVYLAALGVLPFVVAVVRDRYATRASGRPGRAGESAGPAAIDAAAPALRVFAPIYLAGVALMAAFYMVPSQIPFHLEAVTGAGPERSGTAIAASTLFSAIGSAGYGRVSQWMGGGPRGMIGLACGLIGVGYLGVASAGSYPGVLGALALGGVGLGFIMPSLTIWTTAVAPEAVRGRALGGLTTSIFLGQFLSPLVVQPVAARVGLGAAFGLAGGLLLAGAIVAGVAAYRDRTSRAGVPGRPFRTGDRPACARSSCPSTARLRRSPCGSCRIRSPGGARCV